QICGISAARALPGEKFFAHPVTALPAAGTGNRGEPILRDSGPRPERKIPMHTRRTFLFGLFGTALAAAAFTAPSAARAQAPAFEVRGTWVHEAGYASTTLVLRPDGTYSCSNV